MNKSKAIIWKTKTVKQMMWNKHIKIMPKKNTRNPNKRANLSET